LKHRIELFTDGVFAIIITLLVLELHTPDKPGFLAWWAMLPHLAAYLLAFAIVGSSFQLSILTMRTYREYSTGMFWLQLAALSTATLMPLMLNNLVEHLGDPAALMIFLITPAAGTIPVAIMRYTVPREYIADPEGWPAQMRQRNRATIIYWTGILATVGLGFINFWLGFSFFCVMHTAMTVNVARALGSALKQRPARI
jgi:uncharacterized membrane protein